MSSATVAPHFPWGSRFKQTCIHSWICFHISFSYSSWLISGRRFLMIKSINSSVKIRSHIVTPTYPPDHIFYVFESKFFNICWFINLSFSCLGQMVLVLNIFFLNFSIIPNFSPPKRVWSLIFTTLNSRSH